MQNWTKFCKVGEALNWISSLAELRCKIIIKKQNWIHLAQIY